MQRKIPVCRGGKIRQILRIEEIPGSGTTDRMPGGNERHHEVIHFSGHVQGVGFRYTAMQIAREFELAGYVQNLDDGRVRVEAEGEPREVDGFVAALEERMHGYIRKVERTAGVRVPQFSGFGVR